MCRASWRNGASSTLRNHIVMSFGLRPPDMLKVAGRSVTSQEMQLGGTRSALGVAAMVMLLVTPCVSIVRDSLQQMGTSAQTASPLQSFPH